MFVCTPRTQLSKEARRRSPRGKQTCARAAAVHPDTDTGLQQPGAHLADRMPHSDIWELFCESRAAGGAYELSSACAPKATHVVSRIEKVVAECAATLLTSEAQGLQLQQVPVKNELELAAFYKHIKTPLPDAVAPLHDELSELEQAVFPSSTNPDSAFKGWGTLASPDDLHVLTGHCRRAELEAYADAGFLLENSMHDSSREADDGLMCSMYDVLRLYLILNQLLHNEWDVLECLKWPSDDTLPENAQGLLHAKSGGVKTQGPRVDRFAAMPPEALMKIIIGSQLHWIGNITADLEGASAGELEADRASEAASCASVRPQFARHQAWLDMGRSVRDGTVTSADVSSFCEEHLFPTLAVTEYMLAYDRRRCGGGLPLPVGEEAWEAFVSRDGCWRVGSVAWQVLHLDMRMDALRPRRGWAGYAYYNDRAPVRDAWFTASD